LSDSNQILRVTGGRKLSGGRIAISGSSNQVSKCIIASLLTDGDVLIKGAPEVEERYSVAELFRFLGGSVEELDPETIRLCAKTVDRSTVPREVCSKNRISILTAGPLLHRFRKIKLGAALGGDQIGKRPVNFHLDALEQMGATVELNGDHYDISIGEEGFYGARLKLPFPSVMTTENIMITATLAKGRTVIENAAIEPEVVELAKMLQKMGADIQFSPGRTIIITGVSKLRGCELRCMIDRNQVVSFALAALSTGGDVLLEKVPHDSVFSFINIVQGMGAEFKMNSDGLFLKAPSNRPFNACHVEVDVHPGFMTDWQQPFMVLFTQAKGVSILHETVFENRLGYTDFLNQMGAQIRLTTACLGETPCRFREKNFVHSAIIQGPTKLHAGKFALTKDIRAAKCLVIAGLVAEGVSEFSNLGELNRKYDHLVPKLQEMGADISLV